LGILPAKEAFAQLFIKHRKLNERQNIYVSIGMILLCYTTSLVIPNIGDAITLSSGTINPFIGFVFPCLFFLKLDPKPFKSA
jgi:hypothetical protein